jgi:Flp pilus assembly pilin Flp
MSDQRPSRDNERGAGIVEYALLVGLIAIAAVTAVAFFGSGVSGSITASSESLAAGDGSTTTTSPVNQEEDVETDESGDVKFQEVDGKVRIDQISPADGWTAKVTKDNGSRSTVRFTNDTTGERVVVTSWITKKGQLKTRIR